MSNVYHKDLVGANLHVPKEHGGSHQNGGGDEINVTGLSGELFDKQPPKNHASDHAKGGGDDVTAGILKSGLDASKPASPGVGDVYCATDTEKYYICYSAGTWTEVGSKIFKSPDESSWEVSVNDDGVLTTTKL